VRGTTSVSELQDAVALGRRKRTQRSPGRAVAVQGRQLLRNAARQVREGATRAARRGPNRGLSLRKARCSRGAHRHGFVETGAARHASQVEPNLWRSPRVLDWWSCCADDAIANRTRGSMKRNRSSAPALKSRGRHGLFTTSARQSWGGWSRGRRHALRLVRSLVDAGEGRTSAPALVAGALGRQRRGALEHSTVANALVGARAWRVLGAYEGTPSRASAPGPAASAPPSTGRGAQSGALDFRGQQAATSGR